jgi:hypothetical protein
MKIECALNELKVVRNRGGIFFEGIPYDNKIQKRL